MDIQTFKTKTGAYEVNNYGNGFAYEVIDTDTGASIWMEGDEAKELELLTANFQFEKVIADYMEELTGELQTELVNYPRF